MRVVQSVWPYLNLRPLNDLVIGCQDPSTRLEQAGCSFISVFAPRRVTATFQSLEPGQPFCMHPALNEFAGMLGALEKLDEKENLAQRSFSTSRRALNCSCREANNKCVKLL